MSEPPSAVCVVHADPQDGGVAEPLYTKPGPDQPGGTSGAHAYPAAMHAASEQSLALHPPPAPVDDEAPPAPELPLEDAPLAADPPAPEVEEPLEVDDAWPALELDCSKVTIVLSVGEQPAPAAAHADAATSKSTSKKLRIVRKDRTPHRAGEARGDRARSSASPSPRARAPGDRRTGRGAWS
jgi:hypothetical protein